MDKNEMHETSGLLFLLLLLLHAISRPVQKTHHFWFLGVEEGSEWWRYGSGRRRVPTAPEELMPDGVSIDEN